MFKIVYPAHAREFEGVLGEGKSASWGGAKIKGEVHKRKLTKTMFLRSDLSISLSSFLTKLCFTIIKLALLANAVRI